MMGSRAVERHPETMPQHEVKRSLARERLQLLHNFEDAAQKPMAVLALGWLVLVVLQLVIGARAAILDVTYCIWIIFILDFAIRFILATNKLRFLRRNVLTAVSLVLPALRIVQFGRLLALIPSWQLPLLQMLGSMNRSFVALQSTMERRGLQYLLILTAIVTFAGAAGMYKFEHNPTGVGINSYGSALWWTAMVMTTLGSDYFPHTVPGRILCFLLAVFAFSIFGYITAAIASYFVNKDASDTRSPISNEATVEQVLAEVRALREQISRLQQWG